jgi:hypothetical protein
VKIIGTTGTGFIAELSESDLAALVGESYFSQAADKIADAFGRKPQYHSREINLVGASINLAGRFARVTDVESRHHELAGTAKHLRLLASALDGLAAAPLTLPAKKEEQ